MQIILRSDQENQLSISDEHLDTPNFIDIEVGKEIVTVSLDEMHAALDAFLVKRDSSSGQE